MRLLILLLALSACASKPKRDYQNQFWVGCENAYLFHPRLKTKGFPRDQHLKEAFDWCTAQKKRLKGL